MATVAAKVQEVIPPSGKAGIPPPFLAQEDVGSAGTLGSGYVTAGQEQRGQGLFSPQQARRLQEMQTEAPLLYAGEDGANHSGSPLVQLPHSASSSSDQPFRLR